MPNTTAQQRLDDLIATHLSRTDRQGNNFVYFMLATNPGIILSCARRNCMVREEGHLDALWNISARVPWGEGRADAVPVAEVVEEPVEIGKDIF